MNANFSTRFQHLNLLPNVHVLRNQNPENNLPLMMVSGYNTTP